MKKEVTVKELFEALELEPLAANDKANERLKDELETLHAAYNDAKKEISVLSSENEKLKKSQYKMQGRNQEMGAKVLRLENDLRRTDSSKWNKYKEEVKNAH